jgi:hypothetical protein
LAEEDGSKNIGKIARSSEASAWRGFGPFSGISQFDSLHGERFSTEIQ